MSKVVDKRVVEMSFDGSNFEKNVSKSMTSLEKLKSALKMDGVAKGLTDVDKAANGINLQRIADSAAALQQRFSVLGEIGHNAVMKIVGAVNSLATGMASFIKEGIVSGGIKRAMNLENAHFMMQGLLKDESAVADIMNDVSKSVDGTAYSLDAAAKVAAMFAATGMRAGDQMYGALRGVAGVAAMTNAEYQDIGLIFTQISGQGRLMGDQLLQLSTRGINAAATLTNYMNKMGITSNATEADIRSMVSEGEISFALFAAAMDDAFGEHALKANETFTGAMSNIRSALARIGADFISPLIVQNGELVQLFNRVREMVNAIRGLTTPYAVAAADWVKGMASNLTGVVEQITGVLKGTYEVNDTTRTFLNIVESIQNIMAGFSSIIAPIKMAWKDVFPEGLPNLLLILTDRFRGLTEHAKLNVGQMSLLRSVFQVVFTAVKNLAIIVDGGLRTAFGLLGKAINIVGPIIGKFTTYIANNVAAVVRWIDQLGLINAVVTTVANIATSSGSKIKAWFNNFKNLPQVQAAIEALNNVFVLFRDSAKGVFQDLGKVFNDFIEKVGSIKNIKLSDVINLFKDFGEVIRNTFGPKISLIIKNFQSQFGTFRDFMHDAFGKIGDAFMTGKDVIFNVVNAIIAKLSEVPLGSFIAVGFGGALLVLANKIIDIVSFLKDPLSSLDSMFKGVSNVLNSFAKVENAFAAKINAEAMFTIAKAIAVLSGSLVALAFVPWDMLKRALGALGALALGLSLLGGAFAFINKIGGTGMQGVGVQLLALAGSMYVIAEVLKSLASLPTEQVESSILAFTVILAELVGATALLSQIGNSGDWGQLAVFAGIGIAMKLIVSSLVDLQDMDIGRAAATIPLLFVIFSGLSKVMRVSNGVNFGAGIALVGAAAAVWLMIGVVKTVNKMTIEEIARGTAVVVAFEALLVILAIAARIAGKNASGAAAAFGAFGASVLIMVGAIKLISLLSDADIDRGIATMAKMELLFAGVAIITRLAGENGGTAGVAMIAFSGSMIILAAAIGILAAIPEDRVDAATNSIVKIGAIMALIVGMTKWAGEAKGTMIAIAASLGIISIALAGLTFVDQDALQSVTVALTTVMGALALVVAATGIAKKATGTMVLVTAALVAVSGCILLLKDVPAQNAIGNAVAIGTLMVAMTASLALMGTVETVSASAIAAMGILTVIMAGLALVLAELQALQVDASMINVLALSTLLVAMAAVVLIFDKGGLGPGAIAGAVNGALALSAFVGVLIAAIGAIGAVFSQDLLPMEAAFDKGLQILAKLGAGLGEMVGLFIANIGEAITGALPNIADNITLFAAKMNMAGAQFAMFPDQAVEGMGKIAALMLLLGGAELISAISHALSWLIGGNFNMSDMVDRMLEFVNGCKRIAKSLENTEFDEGKIDSVTKLGEFFIALQNALPKQGGVWQSIVGEAMDMGSFGQACYSFITAMKDANTLLDGVTFNSDAIESAVKAGELFAALQNSLPKEGGVWQELAGTTLDLGKFSQRIKTFLIGLTDASDILEQNPIDSGAIESASRAGQLMSDLQNTLPTENGVLQEWFGGTTGLDTFGEELQKFCNSISNASKFLSENPVNEDAVRSAVNMGELMSGLANALPAADGEIAKWFGSDHLQLDVFGEKIQVFGRCLNIFSAHTQNIKSSAISEVVNSVKTLTTMFDYLPKDESWFDGTMSIGNFGDKLNDFANKFRQACNALNGIDTESMSSMARSIASLMMVFKDAKGIDLTGLDSFGELIKDLATTALTNFSSVFEEYDVVAVTSRFINKFVESFKIDPDALTEPFNLLIERALSSLSEGESKFREAATMLMASFGAGIQAGTIIASTAGITLAQSIISLFIAHVEANGPNAGMQCVNAIIQGVVNRTGYAVLAVNLLGIAMLNNIRQKYGQFQETGIQLIQRLNAGIASMQPKSQTTITLLINGMLVTFTANMSKFQETGSNLVTRVNEGVASKQGDLVATINNLVLSMARTAEGGAGMMYNAGANLIYGMVNGINQNAWRAQAAATSLAYSISASVNRALQIHSPSKVGEKSGENYDKGVANGLINGLGEVKDAANQVAAEVEEPTNKLLAGIADGFKNVGEAATNAAEEANKPTNNLISGITNGFGAVTDAANSATSSVENSSDTLLEISYELGKQILKKLEEGMKSESVDVITNAIIDSLEAGIPGIISRIENLGNEIADKIKDGIVNAQGFGETLEKQLTSFSPLLQNAFNNVGRAMIAAIYDGLTVGEETIPEALNRMLDKVLPIIFKSTGQIGSTTIALKIIEGMSENSRPFADGMKEMLTAFFPELNEPMYQFGKNMWNQIKNGLESDGISVIKDTFTNIITQSIPGVLEKFSDLSNGIAEEIKKAASTFEDFGTKIGDYIDSSRESLMQQLYNYGRQMVAYIYDGMSVGEETLPEIISRAIYNSFPSINDLSKDLGDSIMRSIGEGITETKNSPSEIFAESVKDVVPTMINTFKSMGTELMSGMMVAPADILKAATMSIFPDLIAQFVLYGEEFVKSLSNGVYVRRNDPAVQMKLVVNGMVTVVKNTRPLFIQSGSFIIDGIIKGLEQNKARAMAAARSIGEGVNAAFNEALGIHSPSTAGMESGGYYDDGVALGLLRKMQVVKDAAKKVAEGTNETLNTAFATVIDDLNNDLTIRPTIAPIMDLDDVRKGYATINTMGAALDALSLNAKMNERNEQISDNQNGPKNEEIKYEFTQNNYSPKALSRLEIYRQTKNLVTKGRKVVTTR